MAHLSDERFGGPTLAWSPPAVAGRSGQKKNVKVELAFPPVLAARSSPGSGGSSVVPSGMVVKELITNAFKHGFPMGGNGQVQVTLKGGGDVCLEVEDNGKGCPKETREGVGTLLVGQLTGGNFRKGLRRVS